MTLQTNESTPLLSLSLERGRSVGSLPACDHNQCVFRQPKSAEQRQNSVQVLRLPRGQKTLQFLFGHVELFAVDFGDAIQVNGRLLQPSPVR